MNYPKDFRNLIDYFKMLPGVGEKTATRYAFSILKMENDMLETFSNTINNIKKNVTSCKICGAMCDSNNCPYCDSEGRNKKILCVVEKQNDVFVFEKNGNYTGKYHVLGGLISPMDGINPEDILINNLVNRVKNENIEEIILALRPGIEGSTTALYIKKILENSNVKITQIAQGIPIGADMEYLDELTIEMALENRSELS